MAYDLITQILPYQQGYNDRYYPRRIIHHDLHHGIFLPWLNRLTQHVNGYPVAHSFVRKPKILYPIRWNLSFRGRSRYLHGYAHLHLRIRSNLNAQSQYYGSIPSYLQFYLHLHHRINQLYPLLQMGKLSRSL